MAKKETKIETLEQALELISALESEKAELVNDNQELTNTISELEKEMNELRSANSTKPAKKELPSFKFYKKSYVFVIPKFRIVKGGEAVIVTAEEAAENKVILKELVESGSGVIQEVENG